MLESKSDYLHSLNRKLSGLLHNPQHQDTTNYSSNPQISLYSPLHKTDSLRDLTAASKGYSKHENHTPDDSFSDRGSKGPILNVSQLDNVDHDRFFENFDRMFRVHQTAGAEPIDLEEAMKKKNICRVLLDDYEPDRMSSSISYMNDLFHPERSLNGFTNKERVLPKLEHIPSKPYIGVKTEPSMSEMVPCKLTDYKEISKEPVVDKVKFDFPVRNGKEKLPDLKVPKNIVNRLNSGVADVSLKVNEKVYKVNDNVKMIGKVRVNVPVQVSDAGKKNSQQALEKIIKPKKYTSVTRSKTLMMEGGKDKAQAQNDDTRIRVNSLQGIENGAKTQKTDTSIDMGPGTKSKFFLKGLEQKGNAINGYNAGAVNKTQNEFKNTTRNNVTSRTYYSKENLSFLSNSSRDKQFEGNQLKSIKESYQGPSNFTGQTAKMGVEEISRLYKDLRQSIKLNESQKLPQGVRPISNSLKPLSEGYSDYVAQR